MIEELIVGNLVVLLFVQTCIIIYLIGKFIGGK